MKRFFALLVTMFALALSFGGCAEPAPELPPNTTIADVTWTDAGEMMVAGYCVTCCGDDWGPGPEPNCPGDPTPGGPAPHPNPPCGSIFNPCYPGP